MSRVSPQDEAEDARPAAESTTTMIYDPDTEQWVAYPGEPEPDNPAPPPAAAPTIVAQPPPDDD